MHRSRLAGLIIDCRTDDLDVAADFWGKALGAPAPDMPPFDESMFEPMPEVEINPKDKYWVDPDAPISVDGE